MKPLKKFILVFISLLLLCQEANYACYEYPENYQFQFQIFHPAVVNLEYSPFFLTEHFLNENYSYYTEYDKNVREWHEQLNGKVPKQAIYALLYATTPEQFFALQTEDIKKIDKQQLCMAFLRQPQNKELLDYLEYAKLCEIVNNSQDAWERDDNYGWGASGTFVEHQNLLARGEQALKTTQNQFLQLRYAFQVLRQINYSLFSEGTTAAQQSELLAKSKTYYEKYVQNGDKNSLVYHWAVLQHIDLLQDDNYKNYMLACAFDFPAIEKANIFRRFSNENIEKTLAFAKNNKEKAAILSLVAFGYAGKSLPQIKKIYDLYPQSTALTHLLLREVNKLEDWVLGYKHSPEGSQTKFFTDNNRPQVDYNDENYDSKMANYDKINYKKDLAYTQEVFEFVRSKSHLSNANPALWKVLAAYLGAMIEKWDESEQLVKEALQTKGIAKPTKVYAHFVKLMTILRPNQTITAEQEALIVQEAKWLEANKKDIFGFRKSWGNIWLVLRNRYVAQKNITKAALCHAQMKILTVFNSNRYSLKDTIFQDKVNGVEEWHVFDFQSSYFSYLYEEGKSKNVADVLAFIQKKEKTAFEKYLCENVAQDVNRLRDLQGMLHLQEENVEAARQVFAQIDTAFWYSPKESYIDYIDANPFYTNFYQEHQRSFADTIRFNKYTIADSLAKIIAKAENPKTDNRAKYYFLAGNCLFNMTYWGNSWFMSRYWFSSQEVYYDNHNRSEQNYYACAWAKKYYQKALQYAKDDKTKAFILRMVGRCEYYELISKRQAHKTYYSYKKGGDISNPNYKKNQYYEQLIRQYPKYADSLLYSCTVFDEYFEGLVGK